jgi:hypothetical protein
MTRSRWLVGLVSLPPVVVAVAWLGVLAAWWTTEQHPIWNMVPRNIPEAAAFHDGADVVRRVGRGEDPNRPGEVRAGILASHAMTLRPLESAAAVREREMVELLIELGAIFNAESWHRAWCISDASSVREVLEAHRPPGASDYCDPALDPRRDQ